MLHLVHIVKYFILCLIPSKLVLHPYNSHLTSRAHCIMQITRCLVRVLVDNTLNAHADHEAQLDSKYIDMQRNGGKQRKVTK